MWNLFAVSICISCSLHRQRKSCPDLKSAKSRRSSWEKFRLVELLDGSALREHLGSRRDPRSDHHERRQSHAQLRVHCRTAKSPLDVGFLCFFFNFNLGGCQNHGRTSLSVLSLFDIWSNNYDRLIKMKSNHSRDESRWKFKCDSRLIDRRK